MKFSVGLQDNDGFIQLIKDNAARIGEVYFSFGDIPNGRSSLSDNELGFLKAQRQLECLEKIKDIPLNLLLNGNCYGKYALARSFYNKIGDTVDYLVGRFKLKSVTTTSPLIARFVKENFDLHVRASVNMGIGSVEGMEYVSDYFDSFYLAREYNRDIRKITEIRQWCDKNGKGLYGLANSGCLKNCSAHTFHDNLVAHERESAEMDNAYVFEGQCKIFLSSRQKREGWLRYMTFIRPEDVAEYEGLFDGIKLATRVSSSPVTVLASYLKGSFAGGVHTLLEPDHSGLFYPDIIENKRIPDDFINTVLNCNKDCSKCGYCDSVQRNATITL